MHNSGKAAPRTLVIARVAIMLAILSPLAMSCSLTPAIVDENGTPLAGSIASLERVTLNGRKEWVSFRGADVSAPLLLFLAGGPGGTDLAAARRTLGELEKHFVVIGWDQPGAGKSYGAIAHEKLNLDIYLDDASALLDLVRARFGRDKVFVLGESWGSFLGARLALRRPDAVAAFFGTGQMVAFKENDIACYQLMLAWARERGDAKKTAELERQGPPPYYGPGVAAKLSAFLLDTWPYMREKFGVASSGDTIGDIMSPEYGLIDKIHYITGVLETIDAFYPKLWSEDLRVSAPRLEMPAFFLIGRHDINASIPLFMDYFGKLEAPRKEVAWFERSGHNPWSSERERFVEELVRLAGVE